MRFSVGAAQDQNAAHRGHMEDTYRVLQHMNGCLYALVADGHGGSEISSLARDRLHLESALHDQSLSIQDRLSVAFESFDRQACTLDTDAGSSGVVVLLEDSGAGVVAWVGDSFALAADSHSYQFLTPAHNTDNLSERRRITEAGSTITSGYVVAPTTGIMLAMTRAFGDKSFKNAGVIATPQIASFHLPPGGRLLIATDGIHPTDHGPGLPQIANLLLRPATAQKAANELVSTAKRRWGSVDNLTAVVIEAQ